MRIINPGRVHTTGPAPPDDEVPFVPAYDLLEELEQNLSDEEAVAVGIALHFLSGREVQSAPARTTWQACARFEGVYQTALKG